MPIRKVKGGWTFGRGPKSAVHKTLGSAQRSYGAYSAKKPKKSPSMADALKGNKRKY
mgnify:CR=1 FL=1